MGRSNESRRKSPSDLEMLDRLTDMLFQGIMKNDEKSRIGDLLKVIDMKKKLTVTGRGEKKFWDMIDTIRKEELKKGASNKRPKVRDEDFSEPESDSRDDD